MNSSLSLPNKYDVIGADALSLCDTIINCVLLNTVAIFGVTGNVLNVIVLSAQGLGDSTNVILMSLSIVDLAYCALLPLRRIRCAVGKFDEDAAQNFDALINVYLVIPMRLVSFLSSGHVVLISVERTICVYFPLVVSRIFTVKFTLFCLGFIYVFWISLFGPYYNMFSFTVTFDPQKNVTLNILMFSDYFMANVEELTFLNVFFIANIRGPVSFALISLASLATGFKLRESSRKRLKMTSSKHKLKIDIKAVRMLMAVCLVYLGLTLPTMVPTLVYFIDDAFVVYQGKTTLIYSLSEFLVDFLFVVNSSVNFVIYVTMSKKFARTYNLIFRGCMLCPFQRPWRTNQN